MTVTIGVSLKMYFGHREAREWLVAAAGLARDSDAVMSGAVEFFVIPTYLQIADAVAAFAGTPVRVGAQDVSGEDLGAFTGEVSAVELAEVGATLAEIGHIERRRQFGDTEEVVARKVAAALHNRLTPVLCVGETVRGTRADAAQHAVVQVRNALASAPSGRVIVAYEPAWAVGVASPAPIEHIMGVMADVGDAVRELRPGSAAIYGGSAGPGLLRQLGDSVDGVFLGRFAHDPRNLAAVLDEGAERSSHG